MRQGHFTDLLAGTALSAGLLLCLLLASPATAQDASTDSAALSAEDSADPQVTAAIPVRQIDASMVARVKSGLDLLADGDVAGARDLRDRLAKGSIERDVMTFAIATSGLKEVTSDEITDAVQTLKAWPGLSSLRGRAEKALLNENAAPSKVLAAFGKSKPETPEGTLALTRALIATGNKVRAAELINGLWRSVAFDSDFEDRVLDECSGLITQESHRRRMDLMLYKGRTDQARRFASLGQAMSLYSAWTAVADEKTNAPALIAAVDGKWQSDPAYLFLRIEYQRRQENYEAAAKLLAQMPRDSDTLVNPHEWWNEQRIVSRGLMDAGKPQLAYQTVARPAATDPVDRAEAEFHAGWYALRGLKDSRTAENHFRRILTASSKPISAARAYYWLGRTAEAGGPGDAREFYGQSARFEGTFYGQLSAAKIGRKSLLISYPSPSAADRAAFLQRPSARAIDLLTAAGYAEKAGMLYKGLAESLTSPGELALLAARAEKAGDHHIALTVGKTAYGRGINVPALAYPVGAIPANADLSAAGKALAYAIARQESAFNPEAVSGANARGLLQILPGTAKTVAREAGMSFSRDKLTSDAAYNAKLGSLYLSKQIDSFGGSYIMTFVAYNAGPRRVGEWISRFGDPRGKPIDEVVDWVERIPFPETRNYVQRVMENYQVYKTRLGQTADIVHDLRFGRKG